MYRLSRPLLCIVAAAGILVGCSRGASQTEFVQACLKSSHVSVTEDDCKCMADEAQASMSAKQYGAMVLDMQGKKQEAEASLGDLSFDDRAAFAVKQLEVVGKCMDEG